MSPQPRQRTRRFGVFLADFSYSQALLQPKAFLFDVGAESVARSLRLDIQRLLLIFDVVHIPLGQFVFIANPFFRRVASLLVRDPGIQALVANGYVSVTFRQTDRRDAIRQYLDDYKRFQWRRTEPLSGNDLQLVADWPVGFAFDNVLAGRFASEFLISRLNETYAFFGSSFAGLARCFEHSLRSNDGVFVMEDFLPRTERLGLNPRDRRRLFRLLHKAYFVNPDHAAPAVGNVPRFVTYDTRVTRESLSRPPASPTHIRYFYSPSYLTKFFTRWVPMAEWAAFLTGDIRCIHEIRRSGAWDAFVLFYHELLVPQLSRHLRESFLWSRRDSPRFDPETLVDDVADEIYHHNETLAHIGTIVHLGSIIPLLLRNVSLRNLVDNWNRPAIQEFVPAFRDVIRTHCRLDS